MSWLSWNPRTTRMLKNREPIIAVIGAGSWGTALALLLGKKGYPVRLWGHRQEHITTIKSSRENKTYLPGFPLSASITPTADIHEAVRGASLICMVVPSHGYRNVFEQLLPAAPAEAIFISATKGIENKSLNSMTEVMENCSDSLGKKIITAVLSGPSFAKEVAGEVPTAITIGCKDISCARELQVTFSTDYFRVYTSTDIIGLEISASLKNIIAIAAGICDGLDFGSNARAALITRGLAEMTRFGVAHGADQETFFGLSGLGDLVLTCTGALSRNRFVGLELGRGKKLDQILKEMSMVAEGVKTTKSVYDMVQEDRLEMPIMEQVYKILYEDKDCRTAVKDLLGRDLKAE
jgi:glycerol-3-phosphate dehydrogenase (NAD(P)+)